MSQSSAYCRIKTMLDLTDHSLRLAQSSRILAALRPIEVACLDAMMLRGLPCSDLLLRMRKLQSDETSFGLLSTEFEANCLDSAWRVLAKDIVYRLEYDMVADLDFGATTHALADFVDKQDVVRSGLQKATRGMSELLEALRRIDDAEHTPIYSALRDSLRQLGELVDEQNSFINSPSLTYYTKEPR